MVVIPYSFLRLLSNTPPPIPKDKSMYLIFEVHEECLRTTNLTRELVSVLDGKACTDITFILSRLGFLVSKSLGGGDRKGHPK